MGDTLNMSVSGIYEKEGKKHISVLFSDENRSAEGSIPEAKIHTNNGFDADEVAALEQYLVSEEQVIVAAAKKVNVMKAFMNE